MPLHVFAGVTEPRLVHRSLACSIREISSGRSGYLHTRSTSVAREESATACRIVADQCRCTDYSAFPAPDAGLASDGTQRDREREREETWSDRFIQPRNLPLMHSGHPPACRRKISRRNFRRARNFCRLPSDPSPSTRVSSGS